LRADLWLEPAGRDVSNRAGRLTAEIVSKIRKVPGIDSVDAFVEYPIEYQGQPANLGAGELDVMVKHGNLMFLNGEPSAKVLSRVAGHDAGIISESFSLKHDLKIGDTLTLQSPGGPYQIKVEGVYYDYSSESGYIVIPRENFARHYNDLNSTTLAIFLLPNVDPEKVRQDIFAAVPKDSRLNIRTNRELKTQVLKIFDNTFSITYALHAISIAVAILGVMNALFALTMESRRDLGIFKYLGASKEQLGKLVIVQAGLLGTLGNLGGLAIGMALSFLLIHVINKQSFGWTVQFFLPLDFLLQSFALIFVCSILSGLLPARLAEKTPAAEVVRSE
jgi:putative ABC transport system permease protein